MLVHLIASTGQALPSVELAAIPAAGNTLAVAGEDPIVWRVMGAHWPVAGGQVEAVELHLCPLAA